MKDDEIITVKSTLGKQRKKKKKPQPKKAEFSLNDEGTTKLRAALIILPLVIILVVIIVIAVGINQFSSLFENSKPVTSQEVSESTAEDSSKLMLIVSPENPLPSDYKLDLVPFDGVEIDRMLAEPLQEMLTDAKKEGLSIKVTGGFVSAEDQHEAYMDEVRRLIARENYGQARAMEEAEKTVPAENHSELQTGLTVRFSSLRTAEFTESDEYRWLSANCIHYGFVLRFPQGKESKTGFEEDPSLFRYTGKENAARMRSMNFCMEEYAAYLNSR